MKLAEHRRDAIQRLEWQICRYEEYESRVGHDATKDTAEEYRPEIPRDVLQWLIDLVAKNDPQGYTTTEEQTKIDDLYSKAIKWVDEGIRLWSNEEEIKYFANADEASEKVEIFRFVKKCVETAYPILKGEERILMGEAKRQPVGIAKTVYRDEVKKLLLEQMKMLSDVCKGLQQEGGYIEDKCITLCSLTERMEHISSEIRANDQSSQNPLGRIADKSESDMGFGFRVVPEEAKQE